ncbi:MAG: DUF3368 domain-containing protein [bacterium]
MKVVANSSVLIGLSMIGRFEVLKRLYEAILIPDAVYQEIVIEGKGRFGCNETYIAVKDGWIKRKKTRDSIAILSLLEYLHRGEAEAIILAKELSADLVLLDDPKARAIASHMGLKKIGIIGILQLALKQKILADIKEDVNNLIKKGFRISNGLYEKIQKRD